MKAVVLLTGFVLGFIHFDSLYGGLSGAIFFYLFFVILNDSSKQFVFREWALLLYSVNYLIAPAITYQLPAEKVIYSMKINADDYFSLAIPGMLLFMLGLYLLPTRVFNIDFKQVNKSAVVNQGFLVQATIVGLLLRLTSGFLPGEFGFVIYLFSMIRFVGAFALLSVNTRFWYWSAIVLMLELGTAFLGGMYHDAIMWVIFFGLYFLYALKPRLNIKLLGIAATLLLVLFIQSMKGVYRAAVWSGESEASFATVANLATSETVDVTGEENILSSLNRGNQAWIFASTVENMNNNQNYQGMNNVNKYFEAALLPRFLAPNKISSGDKAIFNEFSGHTINQGTSMGLGVFADGYISYGATGVYIFGFALGLMFAVTFKIVEGWSRISPFYVLLLLPLLNYAVRPDCELQTTINHLAKGIVLFGCLVYLTKFQFARSLQTTTFRRLNISKPRNND